MQNALLSSPISLQLVNGHPATTSVDVAHHFGKRHKDVIRAIRNLECSPEYHKRNFAPMVIETQIGSGATRKDPAYQITRDGFVFLCMGFTGPEAAKWKEAYINAFNEMERQLAAKQEQLPPPRNPMDRDLVEIHGKALKWFTDCNAIMEAAGVERPQWPAFDEEAITYGILAQMIRDSRMMLSFDSKLNVHLTMIPKEKALISDDEIPARVQWMTDQQAFAVMDACMQRLKRVRAFKA